MKRFALALLVLAGCGGGGDETPVAEREMAGATIDEICPRDGFGAVNINGVDVVWRSVAEYRAHLDAGGGPCVIWSMYTGGNS